MRTRDRLATLRRMTDAPKTPFQVGEQTAIILRHMLLKPHNEHTMPDICKATGLHAATVRQNLVKMIDARWLSTRKGERAGQARERIYHLFTDEGRRGARAEVKHWEFIDHE